MNQKYKTQGIILLSVGILLSPTVYILVSAATDAGEKLGLALLFMIPIYLPLAITSIVCIALGIGRLITARQQHRLHATPQHATTNQAAETAQQKQLKSNLLALTIGTVLLGVLALAMLGLVLYWFRDGDGMFEVVLWGAIPIAIILLALVMVPVNIKKIAKQKSLSPNGSRD